MILTQPKINSANDQQSNYSSNWNTMELFTDYFESTFV